MYYQKPIYVLNSTFLFLFFYTLFSCQQDKQNFLFQKVASSKSGIRFENTLAFDKDLDVFRYRNFYNGGGVAIGDINNDGLSDIYLTANMLDNKLFLNRGDFKFEDITEKAGVAGTRVWTAGVSIADVNGDGLLDIYVCNSGDMTGGNRENELFINNGDLTFSERAKEYGLNDRGFTTHAAFFDFDQDGDLDCYVLNNSFRPISSMGLENVRNERDSTGGDRLYRNDIADKGVFTDVSEEAGIYGSLIGFGLGVTITDVNKDTWMDIYISNDFHERDYLYINNQDGTFRENLPDHMGHISQFSMGADAGDINNDGYPDLFVTDMLPENDFRLKTMTDFESVDLYHVKLKFDYYEQYMRNMLHLHSGDSTFTEIGQYSGVDATDWSWGALIVDLDNDSNKEIFVANGVYKDVTNQDFVDYLANTDDLIEAMRKEQIDFQQLVDKMPSNKLSNYVFKHDDRLRFSNISSDWGLDEPSFSNGAAYGDLDNDGDLDLVVNNVNMEAFVYQNQNERLLRHNFLKISFSGPEKNRFGVGARVEAFFKGQKVMVENVPNRGFQSSVDPSVVIGMDSINVIDSLFVYWGYGRKQVFENVKANQSIVVDFKNASSNDAEADPKKNYLFTKVADAIDPVYTHREDNFVDFDREKMIYHMLSREGPALAIGDLNKDGLDDFFVGAAIGNTGKIYVQEQNGQFTWVPQSSFENDRLFEDVDATFFDADGDGDLDLYIVSGGYAFGENSPYYQDRLYIFNTDNRGNPTFELAKNNLPRMTDMGSCVRPADYDKDGDIDLFVGSRAVPGKYGYSANSHLLENDGRGTFTDVTKKYASDFFTLGMVTDAQWGDIDNDDDLDLVVVGEWMPIVLFKNNGVNLERLTNVPGLTQSNGWWSSLELIDINGDENLDFIAGNWGLNSKFKASQEYPINLYIGDYDDNKKFDHIFTYYENGREYPLALRHEMVEQLPYLKKQFVRFEDYAGRTIQEIFTAEQLANSYLNTVYILETSMVVNNGDGSYQIRPLPNEVQFSPVFSILVEDFNRDNQEEVFMGGNFSGTKPEEGRYDANTGVIYKPSQKSVFHLPKETGLNIRGDVRKAGIARTRDDKRLLILAKNNDQLEIYEY